MLVIVKHHLVQIGRIDGPNEYVSLILAAIRYFGLLEVLPTNIADSSIPSRNTHNL
jgi:hypothetical protein